MHNSKSKTLGKAGSGCGPRNSNETEGVQPRGKLLTIKWEYLLWLRLKWKTAVKGRVCCSKLVRNMVCQILAPSPSLSKPGQLHSRTWLLQSYQTKEALVLFQRSLSKGRVHSPVLHAMHKPVFLKLLSPFLEGPCSSRLFLITYMKWMHCSFMTPALG